jgi:hypothetical protein
VLTHVFRNSYFVLGEDYTRRVFAATVLIITGSVLAVVFGTHDEESMLRETATT